MVLRQQGLRYLLPALFVLLAGAARADEAVFKEIDRRAAAAQPQVVEWRRHIHQHPELSNREFETAKMVADYLRSLGMEVRTGVAHTGVVGILEGAKKTPVVALRADMDALPVEEQTGLPFASAVRTQFNGADTGVMHACGHDLHTAILMGVAGVLSGMRDEIPGTVKFIFQPAEEGAPTGEDGGASMMVAEGVLEKPKVDAIFGLHVIPQWEVGQLACRAGGMMAGADRLHIVVHGKQTHGAKPWQGIDPIVVSAQIIMGLQTITARQTDVTLAPAIVTIGSIHGGIRNNIIPDDVDMLGTIRTFDADMRADIHKRIRRIVNGIAESAGATAEVEIGDGTPVTYNDPSLYEEMRPTLVKVAGADNVFETLPQTWAEDFSCYQEKIPGVYFYLGVRTAGADIDKFAPNHSPKFMADEGALVVGVRALSYVAVDYLQQH